jgi:hypothetical protein
MLRNTLALVAVLALAASTQAAIIVQQSAPTPLAQGGLVSYTLTAVGTAGEVINTFSNPTLAAGSGLGVHQVWQFGGGATPTKSQQNLPFFNADWTAYDTAFLFADTDYALNLGTAFGETNNHATTGNLGLTQAFATNADSGYGTFTSAADSTKVLLPAKSGASIPFMQVVMRASDTGILNVRIEGNGGTALGNIQGYVIGIPEPGSLSLLGLALAGCFAYIRRR